MLQYLPLVVLAACTQVPAASSLALNVSGYVDRTGLCVCSVAVPDNTFPLQRMEALERSTNSLNLSVQQEVSKIQSYQASINVNQEKLSNLTQKVERMRSGDLPTSDLDFQLLKLEVREMEAMLVQLRTPLTNSNRTLDLLYAEIRNISVTVSQLESLDQNNMMAVRREIMSLRNRLQACETKAESPAPNYGACDHSGLKNVSKPLTVMLNYRGTGYKCGAWGKDSFLGTSNKDMYWMAPMGSCQTIDYLRVYPLYEDLLLSKNQIERQILKYDPYRGYDYSSSGQGSGMILFNNSFYYNCYNSRDLCRLNLDYGTLDRKTLVNAVFNNRYSYTTSSYQDIDFTADESGLWVLYTTEESGGNIVIGKLNASMSVEGNWTTTLYKPGVSSAFMICGVMYATRQLNTRKMEIFYTYDTKARKEGRLSIMMDKMQEGVQSLDYNPNDQKLYMFNDGYQVSYDSIFITSTARK